MTRSLLRSHGLYPLLAFGLTATLLAISGADLMVADALYRLEGYQWALRDHWLTAQVLHGAANRVIVGAGILLLLTALASLASAPLRSLCKPLWYLLAAISISTLIVGIGKQITHVDCPWDVLRYGGKYPYLPYFAAHPGLMASGRCFPAGHAGSGYALVAVYFFLREVKPAWAKWGLTAGLGLGMLFGFDQQLRGAHFLSHDLWSLAICWFSSLLCYVAWNFSGAARNGPLTTPVTTLATLSDHGKSPVSASIAH